MDAIAKPKFEVLRELTAALLRINPMKLNRDNPLEYETEALSILSRFTEAALQLADDESIVVGIASGIVKQSFDFWFENVDSIDCDAVARELLSIFRASFGQETGEDPAEVPEEFRSGVEVTQVTVGE